MERTASLRQRVSHAPSPAASTPAASSPSGEHPPSALAAPEAQKVVAQARGRSLSAALDALDIGSMLGELDQTAGGGDDDGDVVSTPFNPSPARTNLFFSPPHSRTRH